MQLKLDKDLILSPQFPLKLVMDQFRTGTNELHGLHTVMTQVPDFMPQFQIKAPDPYPPKPNGGQT